ncbi:transposase, partial [Acinetobacter baumannii]|nr:transposase [Acinetobacter baumannii]
MDDHDSSYKQLFAHTRMVRDLFTGFLPGHGLPDLATASLEK